MTGRLPGGYALLWCRMVDHPGLADPVALAAYTRVLARARRSPTTLTLARGEVVELAVDQALVTERALADKLRLTRKATRSILIRLENHKIWYLTRRKFGTIVTLCNPACFIGSDWLALDAGPAGDDIVGPHGDHTGTTRGPE